MKSKGFTLAEMLAVFAIIALLGMIVIPSYQFVVKHIYQKMYENKVKLIETAAERFSMETTYEVVNVGHLIQEGYLEADDESASYQNPMTNESMLCQVIRINYEENHYVGQLTDEQNCSFDDLIFQTSIIALKKYKEDGTELRDDEWYRGNVTLKVSFFDIGYEEKAISLKISGNGQNYEVDLNRDFKTKNTLVVQASQLIHTKYEATVVIQENGYTREYKANTLVKIDMQRPTLYTDEIVIDNENVWFNQEKKIVFTMSDGNGSGIYGYSVSSDNRCGKSGTTKAMKQTVSVSKPNGTYYICVRDNAGNWSEDISTKVVTVSRVDVSPPQIDSNQGFMVSSSVSGYHHYQTKLRIFATDESKLSMYLSNTGFEQNGVWEEYQTEKNWAVSNSLDGKTHYVYLTLRDEAGNKVNIRSSAYQVYSECSVTRKEFTSSWGGCSVNCGGGYRYRTYDIRDVNTSKVCSSGSDQEVCNTHACDISLFNGSDSKTWDSISHITSVEKDNNCSFSQDSTLNMGISRGLESTGELTIFATELIDISSKNRLVIDYTISSGRSGGTSYYLVLFTKDNYPKTIRTASCTRGSNQLKRFCEVPEESFRCTDYGVNQNTGECGTCCYYSSSSYYKRIVFASLSSGSAHDDVVNEWRSGTATIDLTPYRNENDGQYYFGIYGTVSRIDEGNSGNSSLSVRKAMIY